MRVLKYELRFTTPAFLGNAEQSGQWRTPPIKALLRQWWRVAYAADCGFRVNVADMRREEGMLFGNAWLSHRENGRDVSDHCKSQVRIRLDPVSGDAAKAWSPGSQKGVAPLGEGLDTSYAWFGLIKRGDRLPDRTAIKPDDKEGVRTLRLIYPEEFDKRIQEVIRLIDAFGLLGSRSRGGWGALHVQGVGAMSAEEMARYARPFQQCLQHEWAASLARDAVGLGVWRSRSNYRAWPDALRAVAGLRKEVRTKLKSVQGVDLRPALGFAGTGRMPSPLRWKVMPGTSGLAIRVFAMPHRLPAESGASMSDDDLRQAWAMVCDTLDGAPALQRVLYERA